AHRLRHLALGRPLALSLAGRGAGPARDDGAHEDAQAGLDGPHLTSPRAASLPDARAHRRADRRRSAEAHGLAGGGIGTGGSRREREGRMTDRAHLVLGVEPSCDDTSVAVLEDARTLRAHVIAAQDLHQLYGGVVPELAARAHLELLPRLVRRALAEARVTPADLTAIAVTRGPRLGGPLAGGGAFARHCGRAR